MISVSLRPDEISILSELIRFEIAMARSLNDEEIRLKLSRYLFKDYPDLDTRNRFLTLLSAKLDDALGINSHDEPPEADHGAEEDYEGLCFDL